MLNIVIHCFLLIINATYHNIEEIENETVDVDALTEKVKRAAWLIKYCKDKLKKTDDEVKKVLKEFQKEGEDEDED